MSTSAAGVAITPLAEELETLFPYGNLSAEVRLEYPLEESAARGWAKPKGTSFTLIVWPTGELVPRP